MTYPNGGSQWTNMRMSKMYTTLVITSNSIFQLPTASIVQKSRSLESQLDTDRLDFCAGIQGHVRTTSQNVMPEGLDNLSARLYLLVLPQPKEYWKPVSRS